MRNLRKELKGALQTVCDEVHLAYPQSFTRLPTVSYYEASSIPFGHADDGEYLTESEWYITVWGTGAESIEEVAAKATSVLIKMGGSRSFSQDDYSTRPPRKIMRWKWTL